MARDNGGILREQVRALNKKKTNADKHRAMSDEELAEWMAKYNDRSVVCPNFGAYDCHASTCKDCWLDWLRQEVSE